MGSNVDSSQNLSAEIDKPYEIMAKSAARDPEMGTCTEAFPSESHSVTNQSSSTPPSVEIPNIALVISAACVFTQEESLRIGLGAQEEIYDHSKAPNELENLAAQPK
jgi:hypothetical protein